MLTVYDPVTLPLSVNVTICYRGSEMALYAVYICLAPTPTSYNIRGVGRQFVLRIVYFVLSFPTGRRR